MFLAHKGMSSLLSIAFNCLEELFLLLLLILSKTLLSRSKKIHFLPHRQTLFEVPLPFQLRFFSIRTQKVYWQFQLGPSQNFASEPESVHVSFEKYFYCTHFICCYRIILKQCFFSVINLHLTQKRLQKHLNH